MFNTFNIGQLGLNAANTAVETISNNIANENTKGYKKRVVQLSELERIKGSMTGRGVLADEVYRISSQYMYNNLTSHTTKVAYYDKISGMLQSTEALFKETDKAGISADLNRYFESIENLRTNPNSQIFKTRLQIDGKALVDSLQKLYTSIEKQQNLDIDETKVVTRRINNILKDMATINEKIQNNSYASNQLLDKRDKLELELAEYVDIDVKSTNDTYQLDIGGRTVVYNTRSSEVGVQEEYKPQIDKYTTIDFTSIPNKVYDSLKNKEDFTARAYNNGDIVSYKLNNTHEVSVTMGESITIDWNGDGTETTQTVNQDNLTRAMVHKINTNTNMKNLVTAYNGNYELDEQGKKIVDNSKDNFLRIETVKEGAKNSIEARISIVHKVGGLEKREAVYQNEYQSQKPSSKVSFSVNDAPINLESGELKVLIDNLDSNSPNNKYREYLDKLDSFAQTLADVTDKYIQTDDNTYLYGEAVTDQTDDKTIKSIGLFSGSSVKTLTFNKNVTNDLNQEELEYLATIQWKKNLSYTGKAQDGTRKDVMSLKEFFSDIRTGVSTDKENIDFSKESQKAIKNSLQTSYDQLVKVDKDEEMVNLLKFKAAYNASAKIITTVNDMLEVLLGLKK